MFHLTNREPEPALNAGGSPPLHLPTHTLDVFLTPFSNTMGLRQSLQLLAFTARPGAEKYLLTSCDDTPVLSHGTEHLLKTTILPHVHLPAGQL